MTLLLEVIFVLLEVTFVLLEVILFLLEVADFLLDFQMLCNLFRTSIYVIYNPH